MKRKPILNLILVLLVVTCTVVGCAADEDITTMNVTPGVNSTYSIGSPSLHYLEGWFDNLYMSGDLLNISSMVGPQGPAGINGSSSIAVGTTTTGPEGSNASVNNSGTAVDAIFDFTIPQGIQGIQGIQGPNGSIGDTGPAGPNSVSGSTSTTLTGYLYGNGSTVSAKNTFVYGVCTTAAATVAKNVTIAGYTPAIGDYIMVNFSLGNTVAAATLNISNTSAKAIRMNNAALTAVFGTYTAGATILYYYDGTYYQQVASQRTTDTDTNTWDRISVPYALKVAQTTTRYKICLQATNDSYYPVSIGDVVTTGKTASTATFRLGGNILYYSSTTQVVGNLTTTNFYSMFPDVNIHYSFNQDTSWVLNSSLYLRAIPSINATFTLNNSTTTSWFTQTLPTTEDGQIYIYLGPVYAANSMVLMPTHPIYEFKNGNLRLYKPPDRCDGSIALISLYDDVALNNSMYYSLNSSKAVYKDLSGVVNALY